MNILRQIQQAMRAATVAIIVLTVMVVVVWGRGLIGREGGNEGAALPADYQRIYHQLKTSNVTSVDDPQGLDTLDWLDTSGGLHHRTFHPYHFDPDQTTPQSLFESLFGTDFDANSNGFLFAHINDNGLHIDLYDDRGTFAIAMENSPFIPSPTLAALLDELHELLNPSSLYETEPSPITDFVVGDRFDLTWNDPPLNSFAGNYNPFQSIRYGGSRGSGGLGGFGGGGGFGSTGGGSGSSSSNNGSDGSNGSNGGNNGGSNNGSNDPGTNGGGTNPPDDVTPPVVVLPEPATLSVWLCGAVGGLWLSRRKRNLAKSESVD